MPLQARNKLTDFAAERIVIAGLMRAPDLNVKRMKGLLCSTDFAWVHHAWLFDTCHTMWKVRKQVPLPLDVIAIRIYRLTLRDNGIDAKDFGHNIGSVLADIYESDPTGAWCVGKSRIVRSLAERRRIIHAAEVRIRDAVDGAVKV